MLMLLLRSVGLLLLAVGVAGCVQTVRAFRARERYNGFVKPVLAMELVRSAADLERVFDDVKLHKVAAKPVEYFNDGLKKDSYGFIPFYWTLLTFASVLLFRHHFPQAKWLGLAAGVCATATAAFDYLENHRMKLALADHQLAAGVRQASLIKWGLFFVTVGLLAAMFLWRRDWAMVIGALYLLTALMGLLGLGLNSLIEWSFVPMLAAGAGWGALLLFAPQRFLDGFS